MSADIQRLFERVKTLVPGATVLLLQNPGIKSKFLLKLEALQVEDLLPGTEVISQSPEYPLEFTVPTSAPAPAQQQPQPSAGMNSNAIDALFNRSRMWDEERIAELRKYKEESDELRKANTILEIALAETRAELKSALMAAQYSSEDTKLKAEALKLGERAVSAISDADGIGRKLKDCLNAFTPDEKAKFVNDWGHKFVGLAEFLQ